MYWIYAGILLAGVRSAHVSATCPDEALPRGAVEWLQDTSGAQITVEWGFGNVSDQCITLWCGFDETDLLMEKVITGFQPPSVRAC